MARFIDQPTLQMAGELVGWANTLFLPYRDFYRRYCRLFHCLISSHLTMKQFLPVE
jgi:hypothetical protein